MVGVCPTLVLVVQIPNLHTEELLLETPPTRCLMGHSSKHGQLVIYVSVERYSRIELYEDIRRVL